MTFFIFLLYASTGPLVVANPEPTTQWKEESSNNPVYKAWASETGERVQAASICLLIIGPIAFVLVICVTLFEDEWVAKIVSRFPKHSKGAVWFNDFSYS